MSKLSANAKPFEFSASAASFVPGEAAAVEPAAAPVPEPSEIVAESWEDEEETSEKVEQLTVSEEPTLTEPKQAPEEKSKVAEPKVEKPEMTAEVASKEQSKSASGKKKAEKEDVRHDLREHLNIVFIGHVDAGKSTLSGQILLQTGQVDERLLAKYEKEAKEKNRDSWYLAYIMDTSEEERAKGKTVEVGRAHFETELKRFTMLDAPGHKNFVPDMIQGAAQADVGVLVISARRGEFETGFDKGGQTREHAMLAKTLGIKKLVILVNKMDEPTVKWSEDRYNTICTKLKPFLKQWGYAVKKDVYFCPVSGYTGANLKEPVAADVCKWYKGQSFFQILDTMDNIERDPSGPVRIPVTSKYKDMGVVCLLGKVENGTLRAGSECMLMPSGKSFICSGISIEDEEVECAQPGENVIVKCKNIEEEDAQIGFVISDAESPCRRAKKFRAQIAITELMEHKPLLTSGYTAVLHIHTAETECTITKLLAEIDRKTGDKKKTRFIKNNGVGIVEIEVEQSIALESFKDHPQMGRFTLRDEGRTIAIGKVNKIQEIPL